MKRINIRLAEIPRFAKDEYHPNQVALYSKFTELAFKALTLPSTIKFLEYLADKLDLENVKIRVCRMPAAKRRISLVEKQGKPYIRIEESQGRFWRKSGLIDIYPGPLWPNRKGKPVWTIGIRGHVLNSIIRAVIHEMLHQSGVHDEAEARRLADQHYKEFRQTYLSRFEEEFKPILKEWKEMKKKQGLR